MRNPEDKINPTEVLSLSENKSEPALVKEVSPPAIDEKRPEQESLVFPPALKKKAEQVAEIMGGSFQDYINVILNVPSKSTLDEILDHIFSAPQPNTSTP